MYLKLLTTIILFFLSFQSAFSNETILPIKKPDLNEKNTTKKIAEIIPLPKPSEKEDEIQKDIKITFKDSAFSITINIDNNNITVLDSARNIDAEIIVSPIVFVMFILSKGSDKFSSEIIINGDIDTANKFNNFLSSSNKLREVTSHILGKKNTIRMENLFNEIK